MGVEEWRKVSVEHEKLGKKAILFVMTDGLRWQEVFRGAELDQLEDTLLGDDAADQERDQHDDGHATIGDLLQLVHHRGAPEASGMEDHPDERGDQLAQEGRGARAVEDLSAGERIFIRAARLRFAGRRRDAWRRRASRCDRAVRGRP